MRSSPLAGVRVVDFTTFLSGPYCTQILGDLGAEIIKVEPFAGDSSRSIPPHFIAGDSAYYLSTNRNKRSIALDLKTARGLEIARDLISKADIVVENYRPGVCEKLGFGPAEMRKLHPQLIWVSISGFGQNGPWKSLPAYDMTVQALSGVMSMTGEPGRPAVRLGIPGGDIIAGMYGAIAALAALADRNRGQAGQTIDISMLDGQLSMLSYQAQYHLVSGAVPQPQGAGHDSIPTYRSFTAGDGRELAVTANTDRMWRELCDALDLAALPEQPEFASQGARLENREVLWSLLEPAFLSKSAAQWVDILSARGVPAALIKNVAEAIADARMLGRDMVVTVERDASHAIEMVGSPIKLENVSPPLGYPPALAQDTVDILTGVLGYGADKCRDIMESNAVLTEPQAPSANGGRNAA